MVSVPHLQIQTRRDLVLGLIPGEHGLFLGDDDLLLSHEIVEGVDEAPVEVPLPGDGMVVDVRVLLVLLLALQPAVAGRRFQAQRCVATQSRQKCFTLARICRLTSRRWRCRRLPGRPRPCSRWSPWAQTCHEERWAKMGLTNHTPNLPSRILINPLLWFPWWNVQGGARRSHILREHVHPHLNSPLWGNRNKTMERGATELDSEIRRGRRPAACHWPVRFPVCPGGAVAWFPRVPGWVCTRHVGFPPSASAQSEPDVRPSSSSNLKKGK